MATVLIVDDEPHMRLLVERMLTPLGHRFLSAENGMRAIEILKSESVDLIITDLVMPGKNGIDLITDVKQLAPDIKILAMSGGGGINGRFDYLSIATLIGAEHILRKPFTRDELTSQVKAVIA